MRLLFIALLLLTGCGKPAETDDELLKDQDNFGIAQQRQDIAAQCKYAEALIIDAQIDDENPLSKNIIDNMHAFKVSNCYQ
jgi:hypothetical protein